MWFKNIQIFRLTAPWAVTADELHAQLARIQFSQVASNEMQSQGWESPRGNDLLVHTVNKQFLLSLATEKKLLPSSVINQVTKARALELEEEQGFAPGRKAMAELKERITEELLPRAFGVKTKTAVWIDPVNRWLVIDASSPSKADEVIKLLLKCCDKLPLEGLRVNLPPQAAMTTWLVAGSAPKGFTIDLDAVLQSNAEHKPTVKYTHHALDLEAVANHIAGGKQCTKLALTWDDKISFVLTDTLQLKRIKPLDVLEEGKDKASNQDDRFDADFVLMTAELARLLSDVVFALGGEMQSNSSSSASTSNNITQHKIERAVGLTAELYKLRQMHRDVLNELYQETIQPVIGRVREQMATTGESAIKSALDLAANVPAFSTSKELLLVAAVEILEPSPREQVSSPHEGGDDALYDQAVAVVVGQQRASISLVQRHLRIGYNRAARLVEQMEAKGIVSVMKPDGSRDIASNADGSRAIEKQST